MTLCKGHRTCCWLIASQESCCNNVTCSSWSCYAWSCHFKDTKSTKQNVLTSAIFETKIRESPYVSKANGKTHQSQEKIQFWRPCLPLLDLSHLESSNEVTTTVCGKSDSFRIKYPENWDRQYYNNSPSEMDKYTPKECLLHIDFPTYMCCTVTCNVSY